jgi:hypothetical protein
MDFGIKEIEFSFLKTWILRKIFQDYFPKHGSLRFISKYNFSFIEARDNIRK